MKTPEIIAAAGKYGSRFQALLAFVLEWECVENKKGEIVTENVPGDAGGLTFAGIDRSSHPAFPFGNPTPKAVVDTYYADYWVPSRAEELPWPVGEVVCNFAINMGRVPAVELLQTAINILPDHGACRVDGIIGPATLAAAAQEDPERLADLIEDRADLRYRAIAGNPRNKKFLAGWLNRDEALENWWKSLTTPNTHAAA